MAARSISPLLKNKGWMNRTSASGATFPVYSPSTGRVIAEVPDMKEEDADTVIREAYQSQKAWGATIAKERSQLLKKFYQLIMSNQEALASLISLEMGKPLCEARGEVAFGASCIEWFSEEAKRIYGDIIPPRTGENRIIVSKQPVGIAALVTPWNHPVAMILRKAGAALAAGCTCIVKPSEETPLSALALAELTEQANFPPGVFNVLPASRAHTPLVGDRLCDSPLVRKLSFTGSTAVGKHLMMKCAGTVKRLSMELGGNAPLIVFNSADVGLAVRGTVAAKFRNTGQTCVSSNRILVQSGIYDEYLSALSKAVSQLKLGDPLQEGVEQGPLVNEAALAKVERHMSDAVAKGAKFTVGGGRDESLGGLYYKPSVLTGATDDMTLSHEETFGPIAPLFKFEDEEEAVISANNTPFGLAGYFFTSDLNQMWRVSEAIEVGMVGINEALTPNESCPFGGTKESGFGYEGSKYGVQDYLSLKYMCIGVTGQP